MTEEENFLLKPGMSVPPKNFVAYLMSIFQISFILIVLEQNQSSLQASDIDR